jgi:hypothetical protein
VRSYSLKIKIKSKNKNKNKNKKIKRAVIQEMIQQVQSPNLGSLSCDLAQQGTGWARGPLWTYSLVPLIFK